jgi:peptidyl-prolyl cis-trans isomerase C
MKLFNLSVLTLGAMTLAGCHPNGSTTSADNVATVNGSEISRDLYNFFLKSGANGKDVATLTQAQRNDALDNLIKANLVAQQADKDGLAKDPQTEHMIELSRLNAIQQAFTERFVKENKPTEAELKKEYEVQVAKIPHTDYHVANIIVPTADAANKIIGDLGRGAKFEEVAKKESTDSSKSQGGELGWMTPDRMDKSFADAVIGLMPGEYTHLPVQTQYGWHIIKLLETRPLAPPTYDSVKGQIEQIVLGNKFKAYVDGLVAKSQITKKML